MILSLDTATQTGWAAGPVGAHAPLLQWGARNFGGSVKVDGETIAKTNGEVIGVFRHWLQARCAELRPTLIVFESPYVPIAREPNFSKRPGKPPPPPMNPLTLRRLLALVGEVEAVAWELRIECREATSGEAAKFMTGKARWPGGRDEKKARVIEACRYHGWDVGGNDNASDALALWAYAEAIVSPRASDHRRRLAADQDRTANGEGPLFAPKTESAPRRQPRSALKPDDKRELSLWPGTARI